MSNLKQCRVCGQTGLTTFLDLGDQPHGASYLAVDDLDEREPEYPLRVSICSNCFTVQIDYTVPKEVMFAEHYYVTGTTKTLRDHFSVSTARLLSSFPPSRNRLVVDIGSNDGTWLSYFKSAGAEVLGVDPARNLAQLANNRGIETIADYFSTSVARRIRTERGSAQLITAAGVFFHLEELHDVTDGVAELLDDDGVFCIQAIYLCDMVRGNKFDQIYHEHLNYWTLTTLSKHLKSHGLEPFRVNRLEIHGGSIEVCVAKIGRRTPESSVTELLQAEQEEGFNDISTYREFAERVREIKEELLKILVEYRDAGEVVYALGAPIKGATILNSFDIDTTLVRLATEVNPMKVGKYIPGCRLPICHEDSVPPPGAYLLLAWNFIDEVLEKHRKYLEAGGKFIVPFPRPYILDKNSLITKK